MTGAFGLWDMSAFDPTSPYILTPSEVGSACGVFRYDTQTGVATTLMLSNGTGVRTTGPLAWNANNADFARFDPCTWRGGARSVMPRQ